MRALGKGRADGVLLSRAHLRRELTSSFPFGEFVPSTKIAHTARNTFMHLGFGSRHDFVSWDTQDLFTRQLRSAHGVRIRCATDVHLEASTARSASLADSINQVSWSLKFECYTVFANRPSFAVWLVESVASITFVTTLCIRSITALIAFDARVVWRSSNVHGAPLTDQRICQFIVISNGTAFSIIKSAACFCVSSGVSTHSAVAASSIRAAVARINFELILFVANGSEETNSILNTIAPARRVLSRVVAHLAGAAGAITVRGWFLFVETPLFTWRPISAHGVGPKRFGTRIPFCATAVSS